MKKLVTLSNINNLTKLKQNNIDGIILGQQVFSNRFNTYYNDIELNNIIIQCNKLNLEIYLNINDIIFEEDINKLEQYIIDTNKLDITGIIYNDISIYYICKKHNILDKLIYNPDTLMSNTKDINYYLDKGIKSVMISKEITLEEIHNIINNSNNKLSLIIHGRLNMSYSKRHFIKNYYEYLNKEYNIDNKLNITLIEQTREHKMPILETNKGCSIYTDFTLESFNEIKGLEELGLGYAIIDDIFMDDNELFDTIKVYNNELSISEFYDKYKLKNYSTGYYYNKTNLVK